MHQRKHLATKPRQLAKITTTTILTSLLFLGLTPQIAAAQGTPASDPSNDVSSSGDELSVTAVDAIPKGGPAGDGTCDDEGNKWELYIKNDAEQEIRRSRFKIIDPSPDSPKFGPIQKTKAVESVPVEGEIPLGGTRVYSETGRWWRCGLAPVAFPEGEPVSIEALVLRAFDSVNPGVPTFTMQPSTDEAFVQTAQLLAIEEAYWNTPHTASATAGRVTITATMTPTTTRWDPGDGSDPVICKQGNAYERGIPVTVANYPCQHTYTQATIGNEPYTASITVIFQVTITSNIGPISAPSAIEVTATQPIEVSELQAVVVQNQ